MNVGSIWGKYIIIIKYNVIYPRMVFLERNRAEETFLFGGKDLHQRANGAHAKCTCM